VNRSVRSVLLELSLSDWEDILRLGSSANVGLLGVEDEVLEELVGVLGLDLQTSWWGEKRKESRGNQPSSRETASREESDLPVSIISRRSSMSRRPSGESFFRSTGECFSAYRRASLEESRGNGSAQTEDGVR